MHQLTKSISSKPPVPNDITVVVPVRNEERNIDALLASLPAECHLVVVDGGTDGTADRVMQLRPERSRVLRLACNIPEARQRGVEQAGTEWVLFTDADVVFPADYFDRLSVYTGLDAIYGCKLSRDAFRRFYRSFAFGQRLCDWLSIPAVSGSNLVIRREAVIAVEGFDPQLVCNEDSELGWRVKRAGFRIRYAQDLPVYATDHRRLHRGLGRKIVHSSLRCLLLYFNLIPAGWRSHDWGYWRSTPAGTNRTDRGSS